jgi:uncharacterized membrane protein YidH (DUF202 family)
MNQTPDDAAATPSAHEPDLDSSIAANEADFGEASRNTYLAQERTLLAWWRTALGTIAVAVAIGSILPKLAQLPKAPFVVLGAGYAGLSLWFVLRGTYRNWTVDRALAQGRYRLLNRYMIIALSSYMTVLVAATTWVLFWVPD